MIDEKRNILLRVAVDSLPDSEKKAVLDRFFEGKDIRDLKEGKLRKGIRMLRHPARRRLFDDAPDFYTESIRRMS